MVKRIKKVTKGRVTRERKKIIVIGTEGQNKSEALYFRELEKKQSRYHCIFAQGNDTDPVKIVRNTAQRAKKEELSFKEGDMAISVFDLDLDETRYYQLQEAKALAERRGIQTITSNPCFEIWYLEHFGFSTKPFSSSNAVVRELERHIVGYRKNRCDIEILYPNTKKAINNCKKLDRFHTDNSEIIETSNPRTGIYKVVKFFVE